MKKILGNYAERRFVVNLGVGASHGGFHPRSPRHEKSRGAS